MGSVNILPSETEDYVFCAVKAKNDITFQIMTSNKKPFQKFYVSQETNTYLYGISLTKLASKNNFDIELIFKNKTFTIYKKLNPAKIKHDFFIFKYELKDNENFQELSSTNMLQIYYQIFESQGIKKLDRLLNSALWYLNKHNNFSLAFFLEIFKNYHSNKEEGISILSNFMLSKYPIIDTESQDYLDLLVNAFENYKTIPHFLIVLMFYFDSWPLLYPIFINKVFPETPINQINLEISCLVFYNDIIQILDLSNKMTNNKTFIIKINIFNELAIISNFLQSFYFLPQITKMVKSFSKIFLDGHSFENKEEYKIINKEKQYIIILLFLRKRYNIPLIIEGTNDEELIKLIKETLPKSRDKETLLCLNIDTKTTPDTIISFLRNGNCLSNQIVIKPQTKKVVLLRGITNGNCQQAINELLLYKTIQSQRLNDNIYIFGTYLPYETGNQNVNQLNSENPIEKKLLKYKVTFDLIHCFQNINYISEFISKNIYGQEPDNKEEKNTLVQVLHQTTIFVSKIPNFDPHNKLQEILIIIYKKLIENLNKDKLDKKKYFLLSVYVVFYLRIPNKELRQQFEKFMNKIIQDDDYIKLINKELKKFSNSIIIPRNIQKTNRVLGILFAIFLCIKCKISIFISGPPGVGKSTIINILKEFGKYSNNFGYLNHTFNFEYKINYCSQLDNIQSFRNLFEECKQKINGDETIPLLILKNMDYINQSEISSLQNMFISNKENSDTITFLGISIKDLLYNTTNGCCKVFIPEAIYSNEKQSTQIEEKNIVIKTKNYSLGLNEAKKLLNREQKYEIWVGSQFEKDFCSEHYISNKIDQIKERIREGKVIILYKINMLYPMLLDIFVKNYITIDEQKYVTLGVSEQELVHINTLFRVIIIVDEDENDCQLSKLQTSIIEIKDNKIDNIFHTFFSDPRNKLVNNNLIKQQLLQEEIISDLIKKYNSNIDSVNSKLSQVIPFGILLFSDLNSKKQDKIRQTYQKREIFTLNECLQKLSFKKFVIFTYSTNINEIKLRNSQSINQQNNQNNKQIINLSAINSEQDFLNILQAFYTNASSEYLLISLKPAEWKHIISLQSMIDQYETCYDKEELKVILFIVHLKWNTLNESNQISCNRDYDMNYKEFIPFTHEKYFYILIDNLQYGITDPNFFITKYFKQLLNDYLLININSIIKDLFQSGKIDLNIHNIDKNSKVTKDDVIDKALELIKKNNFIMDLLIEKITNNIKNDFLKLEKSKITDYFKMLLDKIEQETQRCYIYLAKNNALSLSKQFDFSQDLIKTFWEDNMYRMQNITINTETKINHIIGLNIPFIILIFDSIETIIKPLTLRFYNEQDINKKKLLISNINDSLFRHKLIRYSKDFLSQEYIFDLFIKDFYKKYLISNGFVNMDLSDLEFLLNLIYTIANCDSLQNKFSSIIFLFDVYKLEIKKICTFYLQLKQIISNLEELLKDNIIRCKDLIVKKFESPILVVFLALLKTAINSDEKTELYNVFINSIDLLNSLQQTFLLTKFKEINYMKSIANFANILSKENNLQKYSKKLKELLNMDSKTNKTQIETNYNWLIKQFKNYPSLLISSIKQEIERQNSLEYYQIIIKLLISDFSLIECIQFINLFISQFNRHDNNLVINKFPILENESQNEQIKILQLYYLEMMFYLNQETFKETEYKNLYRNFNANLNALSTNSIESIAKVKVGIYNYVNYIANKSKTELPLAVSRCINQIPIEGLKSTIKLYFLQCFKHKIISYNNFFNSQIVKQLIEELDLNNQVKLHTCFSYNFDMPDEINEITDKIIKIIKGTNNFSTDFFTHFFRNSPINVLTFYDSIVSKILFNVPDERAVNDIEYFNLTSFCDNLFQSNCPLNPTEVSLLKLFLDKTTYLEIIYPLIERFNSLQYEKFLIFYKFALFSSCCKEDNYYKNLYTNKAENIIKNSYNPGTDHECNENINSYFYIKHFFENNDRSQGIDSVWEYSPSFYICSCGKEYELSQCGLPIQIFKCSICQAEIGGTNGRLVERDGHMRIFQHEIEKECIFQRPDCHLYDQFIMFKDYEIQCQKEIEELDKPGIAQIKFNYYEKNIKKIRHMSHVTYRILNMLFYSTIYFSSLIERISQDTIENEFTRTGKKCIEMLFTSYSVLDTELKNLQIESTNIFVNWLIPKLFEVINKYKYKDFSTKENRNSVEKEVEQIIQKHLVMFKEQFNENQYKDICLFQTLDELNDFSHITNEKFPLLNYFTYIPYVNEQTLEQEIKRDPKNKENYPVLYSYFKYHNDIDFNKLQDFLKVNPLVSKMISKFSYKITRRESFSKSIKEIIIDEDELTMLHNFLPCYNELINDCINYECNVKLKPTTVTMDSPLAYILNDDGFHKYGMHIATIYNYFIKWQNKFLRDILFFLKETNPCFYLKEQIEKTIELQSCSEKEIINLNFSKEDINKLLLKYSSYERNKINYDLHQLEKEFGEIILKHKRILSNKQHFIIYQYESFLGENSSVINDYFQNYDQKELSEEEKQQLSPLAKSDYKILFEFQKIITVLSKELFDSNIPVGKALNSLKQCFDFDEQCFNYFQNNKEFTLQNLISIYEYLEEVFMDQHLTQLQHIYRNELETQEKQNILKDLNEHEKNKNNLINRTILCNAVKRFIFRNLLSEREIGNCNLNQYLLEFIGHKEDIWPLNLRDLIQEIQTELSQLNNKWKIRFSCSESFYLLLSEN